MGLKQIKRRILKIAAWSIALTATLFVCHVSARLRGISEYSDEFNSDYSYEQVTFYQLIRYAAYLDTPASFNACINNLRQIDGAKQQWALETKAHSDATPSWNDIKPYFGRSTNNSLIPRCKHGGIYTIGSVANAPTCSIKAHRLQ